MEKYSKKLILWGLLLLTLGASAGILWFCFAGPSSAKVVRIVLVISEIGTLMCAFLLLRLAAKERLLKREMVKKAYYDPLTNLPNEEKLKEAFLSLPAHGAGCVYLALGIDNIREISHIFGVDVGKALITEVGAVLKSFTRDEEMAARLESGAFALLLQVDDPEEFVGRVEKLFKTLNDVAVKQCGEEYNYKAACSGSIYIITGLEKSLENITEITGVALRAQESGESASYGFFDKTLLDRLHSFGRLSKEVEPALKKGGFVAYFQPKYYLDTGRLAGAEVLGRWEHPKKGTLVPDDFFPLLELCGRTVDFDLTMLNEACTLIRKWVRAGVMPVPLSINISKQNLYHPEFVDEVVEMVQEFGVPPRLIEFEIPETELFESDRRFAEALSRLHHFGFLISLTGFGAKYGSIELLRDINIDVVKFDAAFFVKSDGYPTQRGRILADNLVRMLDKMDISVVAEKVETPEQEAFLKKIYCEIAQGFLFSDALTREKFEQLVEKNAPYVIKN
ncbi:MAG: bifunctional diguanylate cyclase/phosphodiesterase [Hydrogenoanaerobacterium sp.]